MTPDEIVAVRHLLPEALNFPYYTDRESPWLLAQGMARRARIGDLRRSPLAKLLERPLLRPLVAGCGGELRQRDVIALAYAAQAYDFRDLGRAARAQLDAVWGGAWHEFELTFDAWGAGEPHHWAQMSRDGGNLVLQLGFPADHAALIGRHVEPGARWKFEESFHPIRETGRPTLAWVRIDMVPGADVALIEEVQSDWLRLVRDELKREDRERPQSRDARALRAYDAALRDRYGRLWPRAALLAALVVLRDLLGVRTVFMHTPHAGKVLKGIGAPGPPVSLYRDLPRWFGFAPTEAAPDFLEQARRRDLAQLRRDGPVFWRLAL